MESAFLRAKQAVCTATMLAHPDPAAPLSLAVDASDSHVGGVLQQMTSNGPQPLSFFSAKLSPAEKKYSAFDRELLAAYLAVRHFRFLLEAKEFFILTDHKPLTYALHRVSEPWSARQQRHLSYLAEFTADVRHVAGKDNVVADALSRPAVVPCDLSSSNGGRPVPGGNVPPSTPHHQTETSPPSGKCASSGTGLDFKRLARAQSDCPDFWEDTLVSSLQVTPFQVDGEMLYCDVSSGAVRPLVPVKNRFSVFQQIHGIAHAGAKATQRMISARFVWPRMASDIRAWVRDCQHCARAKIHRHAHPPQRPIPVPRRKFAHVHVDLVGPFPTSPEGYTHLFTMVDRTTRWAEAVPVPGTSVRDCAEAFFRGWISRFGVPDQLTSDRGAQFTSEVWSSLCTRLGIQHLSTSAYHPQSNGLVERFHRQLKEALRARLAGVQWVEHLPWVLLGLRAAPKEDSNISSAEMVYGLPLTLPGEMCQPPEVTSQEIVEGIRSAATSFTPLPTRPLPMEAASDPTVEALRTASHVYVLRGGVIPSLAPRYQGPYLVLHRGDKCFRIAVGNTVETVSIDRLKPHMGSSPVEVAQPPRRGRPPAPKRPEPDVDAPSWAAVVARGRGQPPFVAASTPPVQRLGGSHVEVPARKTSNVVVTHD
jgi:hypothetical protein